MRRGGRAAAIALGVRGCKCNADVVGSLKVFIIRLKAIQFAVSNFVKSSGNNPGADQKVIELHPSVPFLVPCLGLVQHNSFAVFSAWKAGGAPWHVDVDFDSSCTWSVLHSALRQFRIVSVFAFWHPSGNELKVGVSFMKSILATRINVSPCRCCCHSVKS